MNGNNEQLAWDDEHSPFGLEPSLVLHIGLHDTRPIELNLFFPLIVSKLSRDMMSLVLEATRLFQF